MTLLFVSGFNAAPNPALGNSVPVIAHHNYRSGAVGEFGASVGGGGSLGSLWISGESEYNPQNPDALTASTYWYREKFHVTGHEASSEWIVWIPEQRVNSSTQYAVGFNRGSTGSPTIRLYKVVFDVLGGISSLTVLADGGTLGIATDRLLHIKWSNVSPFPVEVWVDSVQKISFAGDSAVRTPTVQVSIVQQKDSGKSATGFACRHAGVTINDTAGAAPFNDKLDSTYSVGGQPVDVNVTGRQEWTKVGPSTKAYYEIADAKRASEPAGDDYIETTVAGKKAGFGFKNIAGGLVKAVAVFFQRQASGFVGELTSSSFEACVTGESKTGTAIPFGDGTSGFHLFNTPGGNPWTNALYDSFQATIKSPAGMTDTARIYQMHAEVLGTDLVVPADVVDGNADVADLCPPPPAAARRRFAGVF